MSLAKIQEPPDKGLILLAGRQEPVEVQRAVIAIVTGLRSIAKGIAK